MKSVLVSGKTGVLSNTIANYLQLKEDILVSQVSLRDENWKAQSFCQYDTIVHVAGVTPKDVISSEHYYKVNTELTVAFAEKAKQDGVKHFIYISSMSVYGITPKCQAVCGAISRTTPCIPIGDYGKSKLLAEERLHCLGNENFQISLIRVPSIYGPGMTMYLEQYQNLNQKFKILPNVFLENYKSAIYVENLCELVYMVSCEKGGGVYCPDDGKYSAVDYCVALDSEKKRSKLLGIIVKMLSRNKRIQNYFGAVYYDEVCARVFGGKYRIYNLKDAVQKTYEDIVKER